MKKSTLLIISELFPNLTIRQSSYNDGPPLRIIIGHWKYKFFIFPYYSEVGSYIDGNLFIDKEYYRQELDKYFNEIVLF